MRDGCKFVDIEPTAFILLAVTRAAASIRVLEYYSSSKILEYFFTIRALFLSISGCKFPFPVVFFCSRLTNCWNLWKLGASLFHLQLARLETDLNLYTCRGGAGSTPWPLGPHVRWPATRFSLLAACIKVLPVLTSIRVLVKVLGRVLE